jgi:hypothetical protein
MLQLLKRNRKDGFRGKDARSATLLVPVLMLNGSMAENTFISSIARSIQTGFGITLDLETGLKQLGE